MKNKLASQEVDIAKFFQDPNFLTKVLQAGINDALLKHKQAGNPICTWKDGKVVWVPPEEINIKTESEK